ncbi:DMT family transporter [Allosphingosinicella vermicomposti]|uniref:DMT family transporter n=1 Tax=Allosphingosinicella vermicomposti TaxID=614671 RepID=UPI000D0E4DDC|nr:DMT family transporter [Allosphingosinicella vermicomposti]
MNSQILAISLGLMSAVTLAAANMSVKMGSDILVGRAILSLSAALLILPAAFIVPLPDTATWTALLIAMPAHFFYQICLVQAMQRADLSLIFPVMRGSAPLLTALSALLFLNEQLASLAWAGLLMATGAVIAFALPPRGRGFRDHPHGAALLWALGTAIGIALYNVADARGVRLAHSPFTFIVWLFLLDSILITAAATIMRRDALRQAVAMKWRYGVAAGALSILSFGAALYAFGLIEAAKVSALRETSVVFAAMMGALFLGEGFGRRRIVAAGILATGLVRMQFGG